MQFPSVIGTEATTVPVRDADGLLIPPLWQHSAKWGKLPLSIRSKKSKAYEETLNAPPKKEKERRPGFTTFTTKYAIAYGRSLGWTLLDRENYNHRTKRTHDLMLGMDVMFDDGNGLVMVQAAGRSERKAHWQRFEERGGEEKARRRQIRCLYWEFERGTKSPILEEQWA